MSEIAATPELKGKRLLLAEDEGSFAASLKSVLENLGLIVTIASDGEIAKRLFDTDDYALILSDIRMPKFTGIDFLTHVRAKDSKKPFLLMTGFSELADAKKAAELGASGFLNKPFRLKELTEQLARVISQQNNPHDPNDETLYSSLRIEEFLEGQEIKYEIFVKVESRGFVRIAAEGSTLTVPQVKVLKERGLKLLYIRKKDFAHMMGLFWDIEKSKTKPSTEAPLAEAPLKDARSVLNEMHNALPKSIEGFESAAEITYGIFNVLCTYEGTQRWIAQLIAASPALLNRALRVSVLCILIAKASGLKSPRTCGRMSLAALLHDLGMIELPQEMRDIDPKTLTKEQRSTYELHPRRSAALASQIPHIPPEVIQSIEQHHENCAGNGFPSQLKKTQLTAMAKILHLAIQFEEIAFPRDKDAQFNTALQSLGLWQAERRDAFDAEAIKAMLRALNSV